MLCTRLRPYRTNDNAHVEPRNWTHVQLVEKRKRIGQPCGRVDGKGQTPGFQFRKAPKLWLGFIGTGS